MKNETQRSINEEKEEAERGEKIVLYRTIALIAAIVVIVAFGGLKSLWRKSSPVSDQTEKSVNRTEQSNPEGSTSPLGENQSVRLKSGSDKFVVSNDGRKIVTFAESSVVAYQVGSDESILFKGAAPEFFRNGDFLPNGDFVMGGELEAGIWDTATGTKKMTLKAQGGVETIAASPDGQTVAGVSRVDGRIWIWETQTGSLIKESGGDRNSLRPSIVFEDPGHLLVYEISQSRTRVIRVEAATMKFSPSEWQSGSGDTNLKFSVRGKWLVGGSIDRNYNGPDSYETEGNTIVGIKDSELLIYDGRTVVQAGSIHLGVFGSGDMVDDHRAIVVSADGYVGLVNLAAKHITNVLKLQGRTNLVAVSNNGGVAVIKIGEREAVVFPVPENIENQ